MTNAAIEARDLSKFYGWVVALNGVSATLGAGVTGLLGPNGAGKSTLLKLATGQVRPTSGTIRVLGMDPWRQPELFHRVGFCPEQDALYPRLSAREFLSFVLRLHGRRGSEADLRAREVLAEWGLADACDRPMGTYSRGMRQRVKLAQATAHGPDLLILDEPMTGLDPEGRHLVSERIRQWGEAGRHVLVSSHILHELSTLTSEFLLIHRGRIRASGDVSAIRDILDEHPHRIRIRCDDPRRLARALVAADAADGLEFSEDGRTLWVLSRAPAAFFGGFPERVRESGVSVDSFASEDDSLDAVFRYLLEEEGNP